MRLHSPLPLLPIQSILVARKIKDVATLRVANLRLLVEQWGGPTTLAKKLQLSGPSYLSQLVSDPPNRPITEKTARSFEEKLDLPLGWMDQENAHEGRTISDTLISKVVMAVGAALEEAGTALSSRKFADLVSLVYDQAKRDGGPDESYIDRLVKLVSKE